MIFFLFLFHSYCLSNEQLQDPWTKIQTGSIHHGLSPLQEITDPTSTVQQKTHDTPCITTTIPSGVWSSQQILQKYAYDEYPNAQYLTSHPSRGPPTLISLEYDRLDAPNNPARLRDPNTGRFVSNPANPPSPYKFKDAQRRAEWRRLAEDPNSPLTELQRQQIRERGWRGPQQPNPRTGELETMELSHEPIPLREGGTRVVPRWPEEHAAVDPHRHLKKQP